MQIQSPPWHDDTVAAVACRYSRRRGTIATITRDPVRMSSHPKQSGSVLFELRPWQTAPFNGVQTRSLYSRFGWLRSGRARRCRAVISIALARPQFVFSTGQMCCGAASATFRDYDFLRPLYSTALSFRFHPAAEPRLFLGNLEMCPCTEEQTLVHSKAV